MHVILNREIVLRMRELYAAGATHYSLAEQFYVSRGTAARVVKGKHPHARDLPDISRKGWARASGNG